MSFKLAIASGKGGTGKTTISVNLFHYLQEQGKFRVQLVDCDVEEPNDALFFEKKELISSQQALLPVPDIDPKQCTYCGQCSDFCEFNAISIIPRVKYAAVNENLCHSCGACLHACNENAIHERTISIGKINHYSVRTNNDFLEGILKIGSPMQTALIKQLKKETYKNRDIIIYDAPPGTSCPVVQTIADANYVILVTEPTPFGLYDLKLTVALVRELNIPFGVIINKAGLGNNQLAEFLQSEKIDLLGNIPFNKEFAKKYASGKIINETLPKAEECYLKIIQQLEIRREKR